MPIPPTPITMEKRLTALRRSLDPADILFLPMQKANIKKLIQMYLSDEIDVHWDIYVMDGQVVPKDRCLNANIPFFHEVSCFPAIYFRLANAR